MDAAAFFAAVRADPFGGPLTRNAVDSLNAIDGARGGILGTFAKKQLGDYIAPAKADVLNAPGDQQR